MGENTRQFYEARFPTVPEGSWLPKAFDSAVVGMVERGVQLLPAYQLTALINCVKHPDASERFRKVADVLAEHPAAPVLYTRVARTQFWDDVRAGQKIVWEGLTPAIKGLLAFGLNAAHAVVYERSSVIEFLESSIMNSDSEGESPFSVAHRDYQTKILPCYAGEATPWYFFTVNE